MVMAGALRVWRDPRPGAIRGTTTTPIPAVRTALRRDPARGRGADIYESIMTDASGSVTTGLLRGTRFVKDNRLLPRGLTSRRGG
jgi:hypothetical protein